MQEDSAASLIGKLRALNDALHAGLINQYEYDGYKKVVLGSVHVASRDPRSKILLCVYIALI